MSEKIITVMCPICGRCIFFRPFFGQNVDKAVFNLETELELEHYDYNWYEVNIISG